MRDNAGRYFIYKIYCPNCRAVATGDVPFDHVARTKVRLYPEDKERVEREVASLFKCSCK